MRDVDETMHRDLVAHGTLTDISRTDGTIELAPAETLSRPNPRSERSDRQPLKNAASATRTRVFCQILADAKGRARSYVERWVAGRGAE